MLTRSTWPEMAEVSAAPRGRSGAGKTGCAPLDSYPTVRRRRWRGAVMAVGFASNGREERGGRARRGWAGWAVRVGERSWAGGEFGPKEIGILD